MARGLRAVGEDERPPELPKTLVEAAERDRRTWLVKQRLIVAKQIDAGVPAHALGRLIATVNEIDAEIRRLDESEGEEAGRRDGVPRRSFDASAV